MTLRADRCPACGGGGLVLLSGDIEAVGRAPYWWGAARWWCFACGYMEILPGGRQAAVDLHQLVDVTGGRRRGGLTTTP